MDREKRMRAWIRAEVMLLFIMMGAFLLRETGRTESMEQAVVTATSAAGKDYIKWVDFTVSYEALCQAYDWDVDTFDTEHHVETVVLLSHKKADSYIHIDVEFGEGEGKIPVDSIAKRAEASQTKHLTFYVSVFVHLQIFLLIQSAHAHFPPETSVNAYQLDFLSQFHIIFPSHTNGITFS